MNHNKRAHRGKVPQWPELEEELKNWIIERRRVGKRQVSTIAIRLKAKMLAKEKSWNTFIGENNWCHRFIQRHELSIRAVTSVGQPLPSDWEQKLADFHNYFSRIKVGIELSQVGNMDEIPVSFDIPGTRTVDEVGKKDIVITTTGAEKCNFTVVLCCTADGGKCEPMIIFKRKTMPKLIVPKGIVVTVSPKGWMNQEIMRQWLDKVWRRRRGSFFARNSLLIYDSHKSHLTSEIQGLVKSHSQLAVIPGGLTKILQPLDLTVNRSYKVKLRQKWENWMLNGLKSYTKTNRMRKASYEEICNWVLESWTEITSKCIQNGFKAAELYSYENINSEEDDDITIIDDQQSDNNDEESNQIMEKFRHLFKNSNIEFDDEFDGFD